MPRKQHNACAELQVNVKVGEEFEWTTNCEYCDIQIIDDHPLDQDSYHVVKGIAKRATAIGDPGEYEFKCACKGKNKAKINPKIIISAA